MPLPLLLPPSVVLVLVLVPVLVLVLVLVLPVVSMAGRERGAACGFRNISAGRYFS